MKLNQHTGPRPADAGPVRVADMDPRMDVLVDVKDARPSLTTLEWQVVAAAFSDASGHACGSAGKPSRLSAGFHRLIGALTGLRPTQPLADPRLEKLRFFLCFTRDHGRPSQRTWEELLELGFSEAQVEALAMLALERVPPRP